MSTVKKMKSFSTVEGAIAFHQHMVNKAPLTNYVIWAQHVHTASFSAEEKVEMLLKWDINPAEYSSPYLFASDYQLVAFFKKAQFSDKVSETAKRAAYAKFLAAEERCQLVNEHIIEGFKCSPWFASVLMRAKNTISYVLGDIDDVLKHLDANADARYELPGTFQIDAFSAKVGCSPYNPGAPKARFGPGVSVGAIREVDPSPITYKGWERIIRPSTTPCNIFRRAQEANGWVNQVEVPGDTMTFVPKRRDEARTICPAPALNMQVQLMVGCYLKDRMNSVLRNNLRDQGRNRSLAQLGSLTDSYATIDLSAASDSIAYMLVLELLPFEWFHLLDGIRSPSYFDTIKGEWVPYAKFSAMGNGFTFELESLIFYAIAEAAAYLSRGGKPLAKEEISVFGDDIIVPKDTVSSVMSALQLSGFVINTEKSFTSGPFRESCGGDYFNGWLVTPVKLGEFNEQTQQHGWVVLYSDLYYRCFSTPRFRVDLPWLTVALRFAKSRVREHFPRVSIFTEEWREGEPVPSYRWLPGSPEQYDNVYWDHNFQSLRPRRVLGHRVKVTTRYCLPSDVAGAAWFAGARVPESTLSIMEYGLHREREASLGCVNNRGNKRGARFTFS